MGEILRDKRGRIQKRKRLGKNTTGTLKGGPKELVVGKRSVWGGAMSVSKKKESERGMT